MLATSKVSDYADRLVDIDYSQPSPLDPRDFSDYFVEEIPELSNYSHFQFHNFNQGDHQITPDNFEASSAYGRLPAGVARHSLTSSSGRQFPMHAEIASTAVSEGGPMYWSGHNTSSLHESSPGYSPSHSSQYHSPVATNISISGTTLPQSISDMSWEEADEAVFGQAFWRPPFDLPIFPVNRTPGWPTGCRQAQFTPSGAVAPHSSICPVICPPVGSHAYGVK